jgi:hypothetical protein
MPTYIDFHPELPAISPESLEQMRAFLGKEDELGVKFLNIYFTTDNQAYCLVEAPSAAAVCSAHERQGVIVNEDEVHEVAASLT